MIVLKVENYCQKCRDFTPEVIKIFNEREAIIQNVYCVNRDRCTNIYEFLKEEARKDNLK